MKDRVKLFKALSDESRLNIIEFLLAGEKCVCEIVSHVKRTQSTVSIQLAKLDALGIVSSRRDGKRIFYRITNEIVKEILEIVRE